jgi:hypothetical protein
MNVQGQTPEDVFNALDAAFPDQYGLGLYKGWVHIDIRGGRARWKI